MPDLPAPARLAAWGGAALAGRVSPDEAAAAVVGGDDSPHRVFGLPGESGGVNLPYALARLRGLGLRSLRLVLPRPGDAAGLPGPPAFNEQATSRGSAVLGISGRPVAVLSEGRGAWTVHDVAPDPRTPLSVQDAERDLLRVMREATELLMRLDLARWEPAAAEVLAHRAQHERPLLPPSADPRSQVVLHQALRLDSIVTAARQGQGAAVSAGEAQRRTEVLRGLDTAARRAVEAACSPPPGTTG